MVGLTQDIFDMGSKEARVYATERYSWSHSVEVFVDALQSCKQDL